MSKVHNLTLAVDGSDFKPNSDEVAYMATIDSKNYVFVERGSTEIKRIEINETPTAVNTADSTMAALTSTDSNITDLTVNPQWHREVRAEGSGARIVMKWPKVNPKNLDVTETPAQVKTAFDAV